MDCCITRLRATIYDRDKVNEALLKQAGAAAVMLQGDSIQIIYGPKASSIKTKLDEYLAHVPEKYDHEEKVVSYSQNKIEFMNVVDGEVLPIEQAADEIFSHKLLGDGIMIRPNKGTIVAPCDGEISMIYPTKHAIGIKKDNLEILLHFGTNTVNLQGEGYQVMVDLHQKVKAGDVLWQADLSYIQSHATDANIMLIVTQSPEGTTLKKIYGYAQSGTKVLEIYD